MFSQLTLPSLLLVLPLSQLSCAGDANALRDHLHPPPRLPNRQDHARPLLARLLAQHAARRFYAPCSATHPCIARFHAAGDRRRSLQAAGGKLVLVHARAHQLGCPACARALCASVSIVCVCVQLYKSAYIRVRNLVILHVRLARSPQHITYNKQIGFYIYQIVGDSQSSFLACET